MKSTPYFRALPALAVAAAVALAGCGTVREYIPKVDSLAVYKIDINQGNYLSQDMVDKLKAGFHGGEAGGNQKTQISGQQGVACPRTQQTLSFQTR